MIETISNKNFLIVVGILIGIILLCIGVSQYEHGRQMAKLEEDKRILEQKMEEIYQMEQKTLEEAEDTQSKVSSIIRMAAVGDILCEKDMIADAKQEEGYIFSSMFTNMPSYFEHADVVMGAMEVNFCDGEEISGYPKYNSPQEFAQAVKKSGVHLVSLATHHSYDYGEEGLAQTKKYLERIGMTTIGTKQEESRWIVEEYRGAKIAFLSYTCACEGADETSLVNLYSEETVQQDMEEAKQEADFICVLMHWGNIEGGAVTEEQRSIAGFLVEQGANMIIGSHPATIQPVEIVQNKDGENVLVAYSLGNYISTFTKKHANIGMMLDIELLRSGETGKVYLKSVNYTPLYVLDNGKEAENRYEIIDMKQTAEAYANGDTSKITQKTYEELIEGLNWMEEVIK